MVPLLFKKRVKHGNIVSGGESNYQSSFSLLEKWKHE